MSNDGTAEMDEEMQQHVRLLADRNVAAGMNEEEARRVAMAQFGCFDSIREESREQSRSALLESVIQDAWFAVRMLRRDPVFTVVAILTLALGIGATTAVFSVIDGVLLRPLPYAHPDQIVQVFEQVNRTFFPNRTSDPTFTEWRDQSRSFQGLAQFRTRTESVMVGKEAAQVAVTVVSRDFFQVFSVTPVMGRAFVEEELGDAGEPAALVSHGFWQRHFAGDRTLDGKAVFVGDRRYPIVGVMAEGFDFPTETDLWVPRGLFPKVLSRNAFNWNVVGRLRDGASLGRAQAEMTTIAARQRQQYGQETMITGATVVSLHEFMVGRVRPVLLVLLGAVGLLLWVACANVANLLLVQMAARRQELAVRVALGVRRGRLVRQMMVESLLLALFGGAIGVFLSSIGVQAILRFEPGGLPRTAEVGLDARSVLFALFVCLLVTAALGLLAAARATSERRALHQSLKEGARGQTGAGASARLRALLVVWQIGLTLTLLSGAGLLGRSLFALLSMNPGFRTENVLVMRLSRPGVDEDAARGRSAGDRQLLARLGALPGVIDIGAGSSFPLDRSPARGAFVIVDPTVNVMSEAELELASKNADRTGHADFRLASEGYFRALAVPLRRGRMFDDRDGPDAPNVAVISESLVRQRWPGEDPIGKRVQFNNIEGGIRPLTIIGIVGDVRTRGLESAPPPTIYGHPLQRPESAANLTVVFRVSTAPGVVFAAARQIVRDLEPRSPPVFRTAEEFVNGSLGQRRFLLLLVAVFGLSALALAAIGIYGVTSFSVATRTQEIGVRMALGARPVDVLRLILSEGGRQLLAGVVLGSLGALVLTRVMRSFLYEISASDPLTYVAVTSVLLIVALIALYIPARRATRVQPLVALRCD